MQMAGFRRTQRSSAAPIARQISISRGGHDQGAEYRDRLVPREREIGPALRVGRLTPTRCRGRLRHHGSSAIEKPDIVFADRANGLVVLHQA
jgi:hypothetical protein